MKLLSILRIQLCLMLWFVVTMPLLQAQSSGYARVKISGHASDFQAAAQAGVSFDHVLTTSDGVVGEFSSWEIDQLQNLGLSLSILHPDATAWYQERNVAELENLPRAESINNVPAAFNLGSMGGCLTYSEALAELDSMYLSYPGLVSARDSIGTTHEGRTIWAVKISNNVNVDEQEPEVLYIGLHHAREPMSLMNLIYFMQYVLENYGSNPMVTHILNNRELFFVPILNPDGYVFNEVNNPTGGGMWRKNRRNNGNNTYGVDLNRNYSFQWNYDNIGSSGDPNSSSYRGPGAFSEPETQALRKFCIARHFATSLSHHAWGEDLINPWGYDEAAFLPDEDRFHQFGEFLSESSQYVMGNAAQTVGYPSNGNSDDWLYGNQTDKPVIFGFSSEIGNNNDWFWPQTSRIVPLCEEMLEANFRIACLAGGCVDVRPEIPCNLEGSQVWLPVHFENLGLDSTAAISAQFLSSDPNVVAINQGLINLGSLSVGQDVLDSFKISLAPNIANGTIIRGVIRSALPGNVFLEDSVSFSYGIPEVIFSEDAESNLSQWTGNWAITDEKSHLGTYSITDSPSSFYAPNTVKTAALQVPLDLEHYSDVRLEFFATWEVEANWDFVVVEASDNGINYQPLPGRFTNPGSGNHQPSGEPVYDGNRFFWMKEKIDLSQYDGRQLYLRFKLSSNSIQERNGYFFDDLKVTGYETTVHTDPVSPFESLHLYPNPVTAGSGSGSVWISGRSRDIGATTLELYNLQGKIVHSSRIGEASEIDLNHLSAGAYLYRFCSDREFGAMHKLILQ